LILLLVGCDTVPAPVSRPLPEGEGAHPSLGLSPFEPVDRAHTQEPGTTDIIHQAESLLIPYRLRSLLELTGRWSKVRLLPAGSRTADWRVEGRILRSDPDGIQLRMRVLDQENRLLLEKEYAHNPAKGEALFNPLFDAIISDLNQLRFQSAPNEDLARVRFASDLLPEDTPRCAACLLKTIRYISGCSCSTLVKPAWSTPWMRTMDGITKPSKSRIRSGVKPSAAE
jgi:hypothetical protein